MSIFRRMLIIAKIMENTGGNLILDFSGGIVILNYEGNGSKTTINGTEVILGG